MSKGQGANHWGQVLEGLNKVLQLRRVIVMALALVFFAGCAGQAAGPTLQESTARTAAGERVQLAQAEPDSGALEEEDDDFGDLFPSDDSLAIEEDFDPFETVNRFIFAINEAVDVLILQPVAATYRFLLPEMVRDSVRNATRNLKAPVVFANEVWQGKDDRASTTIVRFLVNSTIGLAGLFDVAEHWGYEYHSEDFGQTLGLYGAGPGPYLVLPLFGPSSVRDAIGMGVDSVIDPWPYVLTAADVKEDTAILLGRQIVGGVDKRARHLDTVAELKRDSVDFYARIRSLYLQNRRSVINDDADTASDSNGDGPSSETNQ
jgi:phospholipid-binding lipoprotein MlaA